MGAIPLNNCINYITPSGLKPNIRAGSGVRRSMRQDLERRYELAVSADRMTYTLFRLDVYPPKKIGAFKIKIYVKRGNHYAPVGRPGGC